MTDRLYNEKRCRCPVAKTTWREQHPSSRHRYRVECGYCKRFSKWGTERELAVTKQGVEEATVVNYGPPEPSSNLDDFLSGKLL